MSQFFKTKKEIKAWLDSVGVQHYTIQDDLTVDVMGSVKLSEKNLHFLPIQFGSVVNRFDVSHNHLVSLKGSAHKCASFLCNNNNITSLEYAPKEVGDKFDCSNNRLRSLKGCPPKVYSFFCSSNYLTSLEGMPKKVVSFIICSENPIQMNTYLEIDCETFSHVVSQESEKINLFSDLYSINNKNHLQLTISEKVLNERLNILKEKELLEKQLKKEVNIQPNHKLKL